MSDALTMRPAAILMYHSVSGAQTAGFRHLTVDPGLFEEHVAALAELDATFVRVADVPGLLAGSAVGPSAVAITIDDGLADFASGAAPVLAAHGVPATIFIPTAFVGATASWLGGEDASRPILSWGAIEDLAVSGFEIGSHGHLHLAADINEPEQVCADAARSREQLETRLGRAVSSYAYPFGYWTPAARRAIEQAGFSQACAVTGLQALAADDRFSLPRLHVGPETTPEMLVEMVRSPPARLGREWATAKQAVWRAGRRWAQWGPPEAGLRFADRVLRSRTGA